MNQDKISNIIKKIRKENNLTQKDLADKLNVTYQAVSKWENGKNIPDISVLKKLSEEFDIDISDILDINEKNKYMNSKNIILIIVLVLCFILGILFIFKNSDFNFKKISTNCDSFKITGSIAYNKEKSSIYISNINYCGERDDTVYKKIMCSLYEGHDKNIIKISDCEEKSNVTINEYLKDVSINVDDYSSSCKLYKDNDIYIEITALMDSEKNVIFKIPLVFKDNCNN